MLSESEFREALSDVERFISPESVGKDPITLYHAAVRAMRAALHVDASTSELESRRIKIFKFLASLAEAGVLNSVARGLQSSGVPDHIESITLETLRIVFDKDLFDVSTLTYTDKMFYPNLVLGIGVIDGFFDAMKQVDFSAIPLSRHVDLAAAVFQDTAKLNLIALSTGCLIVETTGGEDPCRDLIEDFMRIRYEVVFKDMTNEKIREYDARVSAKTSVMKTRLSGDRPFDIKVN